MLWIVQGTFHVVNDKWHIISNFLTAPFLFHVYTHKDAIMKSVCLKRFSWTLHNFTLVTFFILCYVSCASNFYNLYFNFQSDFKVIFTTLKSYTIKLRHIIHFISTHTYPILLSISYVKQESTRIVNIWSVERTFLVSYAAWRVIRHNIIYYCRTDQQLNHFHCRSKVLVIDLLKRWANFTCILKIEEWKWIIIHVLILTWRDNVCITHFLGHIWKNIVCYSNIYMHSFVYMLRFPTSWSFNTLTLMHANQIYMLEE